MEWCLFVALYLCTGWTMAVLGLLARQNEDLNPNSNEARCYMLLVAVGWPLYVVVVTGGGLYTVALVAAAFVRGLARGLRGNR